MPMGAVWMPAVAITIGRRVTIIVIAPLRSQFNPGPLLMAVRPGVPIATVPPLGRLVQRLSIQMNLAMADILIVMVTA